MKQSSYESLVKLGLTDGEAKVYAALLELGPSSVGPITKRTKVAYSNIYEILERLQEKGIVSVIKKNNVQHFQPVAPENLVRYLDQEQRKLDERKKILDESLPRMQALQASFPRQGAQLFTGLRALRAAYDEFLEGWQPGDTYRWIYVHHEAYADRSDKFYMTVWAEIVPKEISVRGIADKSYRDSPYIPKAEERDEQIRFVDFPIFAHCEVFRNRLLLVSWDDPVTAVLVEAKHVADNFRRYWDSVWDVAKP